MNFYNQWENKPPQVFEENNEPSCTIPDQTMTIQEIIAKFTRTGLVPQSFLRRDDGGNEANEPGYDPLDEFTEEMAAYHAAYGDGTAPEEAVPEPVQPSAPAGDGGK